jgi:hypothetical protein
MLYASCIKNQESGLLKYRGSNEVIKMTAKRMSDEL